MRTLKRKVAALVLAGGLSFGITAPAAAQPLITGGLVNVTVGNVTVQAPIGIAANVCPAVNAAVLAQELAQTGTAECEADADAAAESRAFQNFLAATGQ